MWCKFGRVPRGFPRGRNPRAPPSRSRLFETSRDCLRLIENVRDYSRLFETGREYSRQIETIRETISDNSRQLERIRNNSRQFETIWDLLADALGAVLVQFGPRDDGGTACMRERFSSQFSIQEQLLSRNLERF